MILVVLVNLNQITNRELKLSIFWFNNYNLLIDCSISFLLLINLSLSLSNSKALFIYFKELQYLPLLKQTTAKISYIFKSVVKTSLI